MKVITALLALLLVAPQSLHALTYYVSKAGLDAHACSTTDSAGTNKLTIAAGLGCLAAGDTLDIHTGVYNETIANTIPAGTSTSARTRVIGHAGETVEIKPTAAVGYVIWVSGKSYFEISHLTITGGSNVTGNAVRFENSGSTPSNYFLFDNNIVTNPGGTGTGNSHHCLQFTDTVSDMVGWTVSNNTISSCTNTAYTSGNLCIYTNGSDGLIENNIVTAGTNTGGIRNGESSGIYSSNRTIIRNNKITGNVSYPAINAYSFGDDRQIYNNIIYSTGSGGVGIRTQGRRTLIYNNTLWSLGSWGIEIKSGSTGGHVVRNNIVYQGVNGNNATDVKLGQNDAGGPVTFSNNLTSNPTFTSSGTGDFTLAVGSTAINTGYTLGSPYNVDYAGSTRANGTTSGSLYDIGAYEYLSATPTITVTSPNGGETWEIGTLRTITWTSVSAGGTVEITGDLDGNGSYETDISSGATTNDGSFDWTVAGSANASCKIKVKDAGAATNDVSDAVFAITASPITPTITITSPTASATYANGSTVTIGWTSTNLSGNVTVELTRNSGGTWYTIGTYAFDAPDLTWTATIPSSSSCQIRVTSVNAPTVTATSSAFRLGGRIM